jgi:hypothetical protein
MEKEKNKEEKSDIQKAYESAVEDYMKDPNPFTHAKVLALSTIVKRNKTLQ